MHERIPIGLCVAAGMGIGSASSAPSSNLACPVETHSLVKNGDPEAMGAEIETVETDDVIAYIGCHGMGGAEPDRDRHPTLAGQVAAYTQKQLPEYKDGKRENRRMQEAVQHLTDEQLAALAAWYAQQPIPEVEVDDDNKVNPEALDLVFVGDKTHMIRPCASRDGTNGERAIIDVPAIAGQNVEHFVDTMKDYAKDKRTNDVYSRMRFTAKALTRDEINELAVHYARLGGKQPGGNLIQALIDGSAFINK